MKLKKSALFFIFVPFFSVASSDFEEVQVHPEKVFTRESTHVVIRAKQSSESLKRVGKLSGESLSRFEVVEIDSQGKKIKTIGLMTDDGVMGDRRAGDGIYTRKFQVYEKKVGTHRYAIVKNSDSEVFDHPEAEVQIKVIGRPSMISAFGEAIGKIFQ